MDNNSATDIRTIAMMAVGKQEGMSLNDAEIVVGGIKANTNAKYAIFFNPTKFPTGFENASWAGRDRYKVTYNWKYKEKEYSETKWYLVKNDQAASDPGITTSDIQVFDKALSDEDIIKIYKESWVKKVFR